jgi:predicted oxidoreductase
MYSTPWMSDIVVGTMRWGSWGAQFSTAQYEAMIAHAMELGFTTFDHADIYGDHTTEEEFGKVLKAHPDWRSNMEIVTKCGILRVCDRKPAHALKAYDSSKEHILRSVDDSLRQLNTDYIDVLLLHRPDLLMDPDEVGEAFELLYRGGKVRSFGVSNFSTSQVSLLQKTVPIVVHQVEISLNELSAFENGTLDQCMADDIVPMAWSPLGGGALKEQVQKDLMAMAQTFGVEPMTLALAWLMQHPSGILPVVGTTSMERLTQAKEALKIRMDRQQWYGLFQAATGKKLP